jgi:hypothetical protein
MDTNSEFGKLIQERFAKLPKVVQNAITSADVSAHMRELADKHKLHLDQWGSLENEVQLTLLGVEPAENLAKNIASQVGVDAVTAGMLAEDIFKTVFEPIREQLERELQQQDSLTGHDTTTVPAQATPLVVAAPVTPQQSPTAQDATLPTTPVAPAIPAVPQPIIAQEPPAASAVAPATPPAEPVAGKVERAPLSTNYAASQASHERKSIEGDPYREQLI